MGVTFGRDDWGLPAWTALPAREPDGPALSARGHARLMKAVRKLSDEDLNALVARLLGTAEDPPPQWAHDPALALELMGMTGEAPDWLPGQVYWIPARRECLAVLFPRDGDLIQEFASSFARAAVLAWVAWRLS